MMNAKPSIKSNSGMTLLEIVIGMGIFAFITIFTSTTINNVMQQKKNTETRLEAEGILRSALQIMVQDFQKAYNYRDINVQLYNLSQKKRIADAKAKQQNPTPPGPVDPNDPNPPPTPPATPAAPIDYEKEYPLREEEILTHFKGEVSKASFTSLNNIETGTDIAQSDQAEISYNLQDCKNTYSEGGTSQCIIRTSSNYIDDELDEGGTKTIFLENVEKFELRYLGTEHDISTKKIEWVKSWDSEEGDEEIRNQFPGAVEITIGILPFKKNKDYKIAMTMVASVWGSNITTEFKDETSPSQQPGSPASPGGLATPGGPSGQ